MTFYFFIYYFLLLIITCALGLITKFKKNKKTTNFRLKFGLKNKLWICASTLSHLLRKTTTTSKVSRNFESQAKLSFRNIMSTF